MKIIRGTNVYPRAIEAIVREFPEVDEFQILITREGVRDEITLRVELKPDGDTAGHWDEPRDTICTVSWRSRMRG